MLWQFDIKYGYYIPSANGGKKRSYMVAFKDYEMLWYAWATNSQQFYGYYEKARLVDQKVIKTVRKKSYVLSKDYHTIN